MAKSFTIELPFDKIGIPLADKTTKLANEANISGGFEVDLTQLPPMVVQHLLTKAVTDLLQAEIKKQDVKTATNDSCKAAALSRWSDLCSGNVGTRAAGADTAELTRTAQRIIRETYKTQIEEVTGEAPDATELRKMVGAFFKDYKAWAKAGRPAVSEDDTDLFEVIGSAYEQAQAEMTAKRAMAKSLARQIGVASRPAATAKPKAPAKPKATGTAKAAPGKAKPKAKAPAAAPQPSA